MEVLQVAEFKRREYSIEKSLEWPSESIILHDEENGLGNFARPPLCIYDLKKGLIFLGVPSDHGEAQVKDECQITEKPPHCERNPTGRQRG